MSHLNPHKLHVDFREGITQDEPLLPRTYTLTHSDSTGDLFLTVAQEYNFPQISGWYTRFMRDEVLAEWRFEEQPSLHVHCHVSGGIVFGPPSWRKAIFLRHMPMVLESFRYGDRKFIAAHPELDEALIWVHFHARQERHNQVEAWGRMANHKILQDVDLGTIA
ncbi:MAG: staygreen family protein [Anaerolineales bacterium]